MKQSAGITPVFKYVNELPYATRPPRASSVGLGFLWLILAVLFGTASAANGQSMVRAAAKPPAPANSTVSGTPASTPSATAPAAVTAPTAPATPAESTSSRSFVPGHILVQPRPGLSDAEFDK